MRYKDYTLLNNVHTAQYHCRYMGEAGRWNVENWEHEAPYMGKDWALRRTYFSPEGLYVRTKYNPNKTRWGECRTLGEYKANLLEMAEVHALDIKQMKLIRLDFKIDVLDDRENYDRICKLCRLVVDCFLASDSRIKPKKESVSYSARTGEFESLSAHTKTWGITFYNKKLQKEAEGVAYRFEISRKGENAKSSSPEEYLAVMKKKLSQLAKQIEKAQQMENKKLLKQWQETAPAKKDGRSINEFLRQNKEFIYTRAQLTAFYETVGKYEERKAQTATRHFIERNQIEVLTKEEYREFIQVIIDLIEDYASQNNVPERPIFGNAPAKKNIHQSKLRQRLEELTA